MYYMLSKNPWFLWTFLGLRWPTYQLLFGTFLMNQLHSEVSDILTKRLCKTNIYFPLDFPWVSHVWLLPISLWSLGMKGEGMMSWSGGGGGEKGWWRIWMFVRSLHHFLLSEALASFLIQWGQRLPDLSGEGRKTAPHLLISCCGLWNWVWRNTGASSLPLLSIWASPAMCSCKTTAEKQREWLQL